MENVTPDSELLHSLRKLARGLSALFWGLPAVLLISAETIRAEDLTPIGIIPALVANLVLLYGLRQMSSFQRQERPWRNALDRARLVAFVNLGLCPFLFWFNRMPYQDYFRSAILVLVICLLLFLFNLNGLLRRLGAMLPDEMLRHDMNQCTAVNRWLLVIFTSFVALCIFCALQFPNLPQQLGPVQWFLFVRLNVALALLLGVSPLAVTMGLLWKTKEVILDGVFRANLSKV